MAYSRIIFFGLVLCLGCAAQEKAHSIYTQGYQSAVSKQISQISREFQSGTFPYYHWNAPIVQELNVPAHIQNGMFIPEHKELVMIKPGQWAKESAYPISEQKEQYVSSNENHKSNAVIDITSVPRNMGSICQVKP